MKKIRITLICAGEEDYPGCGDVLASCSEFEIVARHRSLTAAGIWRDLSGSDVVLLDEVAVSEDGSDAVRAIHESFPFTRLLLVMEKSSKNKTMEALSLGITGVMERADIVRSIRKAIPVLYSGETWISRGLIKSLHSQLRYTGDDGSFLHTVTLQRNIKN